MKKNAILIIIILISIALIGLTIIQFIWIKGGIDLTAQNFDDKVNSILVRTKLQLENLAEYQEGVTKDLNQLKVQNRSIFKAEIDPLTDFRTPSFGTDRFYTWRSAPKAAFENINLYELDKFMKKEVMDEKISLDYNYGVFSNEDESYMILNGKYAVVMENVEGSDLEVNQSLSRSEYKIDLFIDDMGKSPGQLRLFFPARTSFLIRSSLSSLISSLLFTGIILFCFIYTITVIMTQRKVSLMKTDFINNMTHEFKTPIATISLATDSILSPKILGDDNKVKRFINIIKQENKRMLGQVEKVLQIGQLEKRDFQLKISVVDINNIVRDAVDHTSLTVNKLGGEITFNLDKNIAPLQIDEIHVSNVVHNLLDNATKYSSGTPKIHLNTIQHETAVEVSVKDHGIGMTKEEVRRIFDKFYRVSTGNLHDVKGFGLGLSYVKAIVDAHKGKIEVISELGQGSTFSVFFPN
ncbi:MAG: HAMP domain-containing sensor histidine kinase [Saprospiraceae bacterium]